MTAGQSELRDIFRAEDGSEWHAWHSTMDEKMWLWVATGVGVGPLLKSALKMVQEGPYRVWTEKDLGDGTSQGTDVPVRWHCDLQSVQGADGD